MELLGLLSSAGLAEAGGLTSTAAHSRGWQVGGGDGGQEASVLPHTGIPPQGGLSFLGRWLPSRWPRQSPQSYGLALEVAHCHFHHIPLVVGARADSVRDRTT